MNVKKPIEKLLNDIQNMTDIDADKHLNILVNSIIFKLKYGEKDKPTAFVKSINTPTVKPNIETELTLKQLSLRKKSKKNNRLFKVKHKVIEWRKEGWSYQKIADELNHKYIKNELRIKSKQKYYYSKYIEIFCKLYSIEYK